MRRGQLHIVVLGLLAWCVGCGGPAPAAPPKPEPAASPKSEAPPPAPEPVADPRLQRGAELYGRMCVVCHGANGEGYKADQAPALAHPEYLATVTDQFLAYAIDEGRIGTQMSAWGVAHGGPLTATDVQAVVAYLRSWQRQSSIPLDESPVRGAVPNGTLIFNRECARCHGPKAPNLRLLQPQILKYASPGFLRYAIKKGRPPTPMPAFEAALGEQGVEDVVAYLKSLPTEVAPPPPVPSEPPPIALAKLRKGPQPVGFETFPKFTSVAVVAREYKRKAKMMLLDARAPSDFVREHIAGASSVPFYDPSPYFEKLPKDVWLVAYCGCPHAESGALAQKLMAAGFTKVTVLDEGLWEWKAKGHPMKEGMEP